MAEERTLGLARAPEHPAEELSKEELQRRMEEARDSISHTVTEIKETVATQYQAVKDTLDWREQFKKRPLAWSAGSVGVGFLVGYGIAAVVKGESNGQNQSYDAFPSGAHAYASQPVLGEPASMRSRATADHPKEEDSGPGLLERFKTTPVYDRMKNEVGDFGNAILDEVSKTAKTVVLPALIKSLKDFIGGYLPASDKAPSMSTRREPNRTSSRSDSSYQPALERQQTS
jgi:hypothetical protein